MWAKHSPLPYTRDLPLLHMPRPSHVLLQIGLYYKDIDGEYRGGGVEEVVEGNEGGDVSIE